MKPTCDNTQHWLITSLVAIGSDLPGCAEVAKELRELALLELERCLVDKDRLRLYTRALQAALHGHAPYVGGEFLEDDVKRADVAAHGLRVLDDTDLVRFSLNPVALWTAHDYIRDCVLTDYWLAVEETLCAFSDLENTCVHNTSSSHSTVTPLVEAGLTNPSDTDQHSADSLPVALPTSAASAIAQPEQLCLISPVTPAERFYAQTAALLLRTIVGLDRLKQFRRARLGAATDGREIDLDSAIRLAAPWLGSIALYKFRDAHHYCAVASRRQDVKAIGAIRLVLRGDDNTCAEVVLSPQRLRRSFPNALPAEWERLTLEVLSEDGSG